MGFPLNFLIGQVFTPQIKPMFKALLQPVFLIRASQGVPYDPEIFLNRAQSIKNLSTVDVPGGHHVHMDDAKSVADGIESFLR